MCYNKCMKIKTRAIIKNIISSILVFATIIASIFCLTAILFNITYTIAPIKNYCMYPLINKYAPDEKTYSDYAYLNKFAEFKNNDIVIASPNWPLTDTSVIKRLIASPGDTVEILETETKFQLLVNNELVYDKDKTTTNVHGGIGGTIGYYQNYLTLINSLSEKNITISKSGNKCIKLNDDEYFLMGDNWGESYDSIENGFVKKSQIDGRVDFVIDVKENKKLEIFKEMCKALFCFK